MNRRVWHRRLAGGPLTDDVPRLCEQCPVAPRVRQVGSPVGGKSHADPILHNPGLGQPVKLHRLQHEADRIAEIGLRLRQGPALRQGARHIFGPGHPPRLALQECCAVALCHAEDYTPGRTFLASLLGAGRIVTHRLQIAGERIRRGGVRDRNLARAERTASPFRFHTCGSRDRLLLTGRRSRVPPGREDSGGPHYPSDESLGFIRLSLRDRENSPPTDRCEDRAPIALPASQRDAQGQPGGSSPQSGQRTPCVPEGRTRATRQFLAADVFGAFTFSGSIRFRGQL